MPVEVILPKVDMDMTHGTIAVWHVAEGETVEKGAALFDIETDKAAMEVEAPASGLLHHIAAQPGDRVAVGAAVAWIYAEGEDVGPPPAAAGAPGPVAETMPQDRGQERPSDPDTAEIGETEDPAPGAGVRVRATPAARKAAREAGLSLETIRGSGPNGRLQAADVAAAMQADRAGASAPVPGWSPQSGPLSVTRRKGRGMPVVLIHGFTADSPSWAPLEKALGAGRPLIRIDLPGHGTSPRRRIDGFAALARMLVEAFDDATRDLDRVHIVGHSLGGALALAIADIRARKVAGLSLIAPAGLGPQIDAATIDGIVRASRVESLAPWLRRLTAHPDAIGDDYVRAAMAPRRDPALRACQAAMADALFPDGVQAFDLRPAIQRLTLPAQIIWGRKDAILPFAQGIAAGGDNAVHLLSDAGHIPQIECPGRVAPIVARLLLATDRPG